METSHNISNTFGPGMANVQCYGGSSFAKETRALKKLKPWRSPWKLQWPIERIIKAHPLTTTRKIAEELNVDHSMVYWHLEQIGKVKKLKWVPHELTSNFKKIILKCCLILFYITTINHFLIRLDVQQKADFIQQPAMTSSVVGPRRSAKALLKPKHCKKRSWSLFGGLLPIWSTTAFWIPVKPLLRRILSKSMRCTENCNIYSQHWSTERAQFFSTTTPDCM